MDLNFKNKAAKELDRITLKAEKVELGSVDELEAVLQAAKNNNKFSKQKVDEAATINKAGYNILKEQIKLDELAGKIEKNAENLYKEYSNKANDLGINPRETKAFKIYNDILAELLNRSDENSVKSVLTMRLK